MGLSEDYKSRVFRKKDSVLLAKRFIRECPNTDIYKDRLAYELDMILRKKFVDYLLQVCDILDLVKDIPHIIRGCLRRHLNYIVYDDDAIHYIKSILNCSEGKADMYRKAFAKKRLNKMFYFEYIINDFSNRDEIVDNLTSLRKYSFCKSHAFSYAKLVWALAYQKANNPKKFWVSTLNNCSSMYRTWVHFNEAKKSGLKLTLGKKPWVITKDDKLVGTGKDKNRGKLCKDASALEQYKLYGYWVSNKFLDNMYVKVINEKTRYVKFRGLIATGRQYRGYRRYNKGCTFITIGYKTGYMIDITIKGMYKIGIFDAVSGEGYIRKYIKGSDYLTIDVVKHKFERF